MIWSEFPTWQFCPIEAKTTFRFAVKIVASVEPPFVGEKHRDGPLVVRTLINSSQKLVGYSFTFKALNHEHGTVIQPAIRSFTGSLAASYGAMDCDEMLLVLGSPHCRVIRAGLLNPSFHVVLRNAKKAGKNGSQETKLG